LGGMGVLLSSETVLINRTTNCATHTVYFVAAGSRMTDEFS